jgi:hypothetical protein
LQSNHKEQETIRDYLLGQATQEDSLLLEEQFLTGGALFQELLIVEDELIDQYVSDKLSLAERERFETHFLGAPERQRKLAFGRALHKHVNFAATSEPLEQYSAEEVSDEKPGVAKPPPKRGLFSFLPFSNPIVSYSLAAVAVLIIFAFSWVALKNLRTPARNPANVLAVALEPGLTRDGGEIKKFTIPPDSDSIRLQLALPDNQYQSYKAVLQNSNGDILLTKSNLKAQSATGQHTLLVDLIPKLIPPGDYRIALSGLTADGNAESVSSYSFRVLSK